MSEIEKAIKRLESCSIIPFDEDSQEVCGLAIQALQEKQEREKGCEYCNDRKPLLDELGTTQIDGIAGELWHTAQVSADDIYEEHTDINFCPMCGRDLRKDENDG